MRGARDGKNERGVLETATMSGNVHCGASAANKPRACVQLPSRLGSIVPVQRFTINNTRLDNRRRGASRNDKHRCFCASQNDRL